MKRLECVGGPKDGEFLELDDLAEGAQVHLKKAPHLAYVEESVLGGTGTPLMRVGLYQVGHFQRWGRTASVRVLHWRGEA